MIIKNNQTRIDFLETGDIRSISFEDIIVNQLFCNPIDEMASNLFLRLSSRNGTIDAHPLLGKASNSVFSVSDELPQVQFKGIVGSAAYHVFLTVAHNGWFYDIIVTNHGTQLLTFDLVYGQDIGLAAKEHIQHNEAYNSQYIDHKAFETEQGYVVLSRQNQWRQRDKEGFPVSMLGSFHKTRAFSTDGYHFFGMGYKWDNVIEALKQPLLNNRIYQYEFAYIALQSECFVLAPGEKCHLTFYGTIIPDWKSSVTGPFDIAPIREAHRSVTFNENTLWNRYVPKVSITNTLSGLPINEQELQRWYPDRRHEEYHEGSLLSFFTGESAHVVLAEKEKLVERPHGHILLAGHNDAVRKDLLASTNYIMGVFSSQTVLGNTSFNKLNSVCRNGLNVQKTTGQRVMVRRGSEYKLLTMPSLYEMGMNYSRWLYKLDDDILEFRVYTHLEQPVLDFEFFSHRCIPYDLVVYNQLCSAPGEYDAPLNYSCEGNTLILKHQPGTLSGNTYPDLTFKITSDKPYELLNQSFFLGDLEVPQEPAVLWHYPSVSGFRQTTVGLIDGKEFSLAHTDFYKEVRAYSQWMVNSINGFRLSYPANSSLNAELDKMNDIALWFSHNAMIHYASPHGLEQSGGAAWGTRDVCQGPFEYFLATQKISKARDILLTLYTHQYIEDGNWPQWFMFDRYYRIQHHESHGDIIVWPLKALAAYLNTTGDMDILKERLKYTTKNGYTFTDSEETLLEHVKKQIQNIREHFIPGTSLSCYGDGDWDDTLQPYDPALRVSMVSGWTVSLTYQAFTELSDALSSISAEFAEELRQVAQNIRNDYHRYVICDGIASGFIVFKENSVKYLLHPQDKETGLSYRLLPMTRSMISEMFTPGEAAEHYRLIREHLYHPDGVRLMDTTCRYRGGVNTYFKRAETAANFGREIGLQYVHAHIRFVESMAKIGQKEEAWDALLKVNPIGIREVVPNAAPRQSNCYFSSSDAQFDNRYEAMEHFDKLRTGQIGVKAGWRIYSSGPGIYLNQLISNVLGLRLKRDRVILDPILPKKCDGMHFEYGINGRKVTIVYHLTDKIDISGLFVDGKAIAFETLQNPYRSGGISFPEDCIRDGSVIDVYR